MSKYLEYLKNNEDFRAYLTSQIWVEEAVFCKCGFAGERKQLIHHRDIEMMHPKNRGRIYLSEPNYYDIAYYTTFESCPECKRVIFADDEPRNLISKEEYRKRKCMKI